jgi:hypothetical protein
MTNDNKWSPCESGTLQHLSDTLRGNQRRKQLTRRSALSALALTGATAAFFAINGRENKQTVSHIACSAVHTHAHSYVQGNANPDLTAQIDAHRLHCPRCDDFLKTLES